MKNKRTAFYIANTSKISLAEHIKALCEILDAVNSESNTAADIAKTA